MDNDINLGVAVLLPSGSFLVLSRILIVKKPAQGGFGEVLGEAFIHRFALRFYL